MSKNKFRTLVCALVIIYMSTSPWVHFHSGEIYDWIDVVLTVLDIFTNSVLLIINLVAVIGVLHFGPKAWNEDNEKNI